jgi:hypothetical protein
MQVAIGPLLALYHSFMLKGCVLQNYVISYQHRHATVMKLFASRTDFGWFAGCKQH